MDHVEFSPYHNHFIRFRYKGEEKKGVVLDDVPYHQKVTGKEYVFIPWDNLKDWKIANSQKDAELKEKLVEIIDIRYINEIDKINKNNL